MDDATREELESLRERASGPAADTGCVAGRFPAAVQVVVDDTSPQALLARYRVGSALQFVLDGRTVHVFADTAPADPAGGS